MPPNICVKLTTASLFINVKLLHFSGEWGLKPHSDRCSNRSAYIIRSWAKTVERGVFLKNIQTSKKRVVASATSTEQCQPRGQVCRHAVGRVRRWWELAAGDWNNIWAAASWPGQFERAPVVPQTLISQSWGRGGGRGGRHRLYSRAHVFWLMCFLPSHCGGPHSAAELNRHSRTVLLYPQGCLCGVGPRPK